MTTVIFADNAYGTIAASLAAGDTSLSLTAGHGARFPAVSSASLYCILIDSSNVVEEIIITAHTANADTATITRGAGGTTAKAWAAGARIEARLSASSLEVAYGSTAVQTLTNKTLANVVLTGTSTVAGVVGATISTSTLASPVITGTAVVPYVFGASLVPLAAGTAATSATLDFTSVITDTYDTYLLDVVNIAPATDGASLHLRASTNNGSSFLATNQYYHARVANATDAVSTVVGAGAEAGAEIGLVAGIGNATSEIASGGIFIRRTAAGRCTATWQFTSVDSGGNLVQTGGGGLVGANAVNAVRLLMSSGNIASGVARLYGIRKA